ncbi:capsid protein [Faeces associated gemycircularvirus 22]|uniref:Capsid protein n=1 Tax=bovine associated gemycircularvirus 1 TaxID=1985372 RepID=A0A160HWN5_9VIRU|nr:capsid protein [Faeces associated gemycircularvirus 22]ANC51608.1 capsid protein [Faeces associated gemycircularvirus 22]
MARLRYVKRRYRRKPNSRRSTAKTRPYRKRRVTPRRLTKKAILNITSKKKRNTMLSVTNTNSAGVPVPIALGGVFINGTGSGKIIWSPTAMDLSTDDIDNTAISSSLRTSQVCYMRGVAEHLRIQTSNGLAWFHRRICFTSKAPEFRYMAGDSAPNAQWNPYIENSNGLQRFMLNMQVNNMNNTISRMETLIFKGQQGKDWSDPLIAPLDRYQIDVKFDKTWTIRSGNEKGTVAERKLWHPMNKNLVYADDENGTDEVTSHFSVTDKQGMGDYYIYDIFIPGAGSSSGDYINITPSTTIFWHEK